VRDGRDRQHQDDDRDTHDECVRRRPDELHDEETDEDQRAAGIGHRLNRTDEVAPEHLQRSAQPDDQCRQHDVSDHRHPVIIICELREHATKLERAVLATLDGGVVPDPDALLFLLRRAQTTAGDLLVERVGEALAAALPEAERASTVPACAAWVALLVEARQLSDDDRLDRTLARIVPLLQAQWTATAIGDAAVAIEATLHAVTLPAFRSIAADAIDHLERLIATFYRPGAGVGAASDQVRTASALLTAYGLSGRLPYPMLAEELMQSARTALPSDFTTTCIAARVLARLAALHADSGYRAAAILAPQAAYRADALRLLDSVASDARARGAAGAIYGVALLELESASSLP